MLEYIKLNAFMIRMGKMNEVSFVQTIEKKITNFHFSLFQIEN